MKIQRKTNDKSVVVFLADGFKEIEALAFTDILRRAEIDTKLVSINETKNVIGSHGISINADITVKELDFNSIEAVVLPGGMPGTLNLQSCKTVIDAIEFAVDNKKTIGAICAAPIILGGLGLLDGKEATCYPGFEDRLLGSHILNEKVVKDGIFITSKGAGTVKEFAECFIQHLKNKEIAEKVISAMQY